ncbi:MAG: hypothetical protein BWY65_02401 [Firmicutes bacterium ADurb.Bin373]|nr:MAG: hypothetical protein BWY65_02401 [Firmicutes bacterium ADurb.Bin373]
MQRAAPAVSNLSPLAPAHSPFSFKAVNTQVTAPSRALRKKIDSHPRCWFMTPPNTGPSDRPV